MIAGAWERHGICGYEPGSGELLWQRKDLKRPQDLTPAGGGELLAACLDERPMHVLDAATGETVATVRAVDEFRQSPLAQLGVASSVQKVSLIDTESWKREWTSRVEGFGTLDVAFAPDRFVVSELVDGAGALLCFDPSGELLWDVRLAEDVNARTLQWDEESARWVAVLHHVNHEIPDTLVRWSEDDERVDEVPLEGQPDELELLPGGRYLVTATHGVLDARDGTRVWDLEGG